MATLISLVKNRAWILPHWLQAIRRLGVDRYIFLDDASTDGSRAMLAHFAVDVPNTTVLVNDVPFADNTSSRVDRNRLDLYHHLARLRNITLDAAAGADRVLSLDSDILPVPTLLAALARHQRPYVATLINNVRTIHPRDCEKTEWNDATNILVKSGTGFHHLRPVPLNSLIPCDLSGACMLLQGEALPARFGFHGCGEDGGHALDLSRLGVPICADTTPRAVHCYAEKDLPQALRTLAYLSSTEESL